MLGQAKRLSQVYTGMQMSGAPNFEGLELRLKKLDCSTPDCRAEISVFRRELDAACDQKYISLKEWRELVLRLSPIQEKCLQLQPDAWRRPLPKG